MNGISLLQIDSHLRKAEYTLSTLHTD